MFIISLGVNTRFIVQNAWNLLKLVLTFLTSKSCVLIKTYKINFNGKIKKREKQNPNYTLIFNLQFSFCLFADQTAFNEQSKFWNGNLPFCCGVRSKFSIFKLLPEICLIQWTLANSNFYYSNLFIIRPY